MQCGQEGFVIVAGFGCENPFTSVPFAISDMPDVRRQMPDAIALAYTHTYKRTMLSDWTWTWLTCTATVDANFFFLVLTENVGQESQRVN